MRRVLIVGNSGGGKTTLARALGAKLGLPVVFLDVLFWKPGWAESEHAEFRARVADALAGPAWVCDGNFTSSFDQRMPLADTIIWIDQPRWLCLFRVVWRIVTYRHGVRPDMAQGCRERVDFTFWRWVWDYDANVKPKLEAALREHAGHARVVHLRSDREIAAFVAEA